MKFYQFKTFTTSYFFPKGYENEDFLFGLYTPYGGFFSKLYWYLFRKTSFIKNLTRLDESLLPFDYQQLKIFEGNDSIMSFNIGSPGSEQKMTMIGFHLENKKRFFCKYAIKEKAKKLTLNEISVLSHLKDTGLVPNLISSNVSTDHVFFKTEFVSGHKLASLHLSEEITQLLLQLSKFKLPLVNEKSDGLMMALSHGDFCPWNIIQNGDKLFLIDWELAENRPLGYDLFTYIFQPAFLVKKRDDVNMIMVENEHFIKQYFDSFGINNFIDYLNVFATKKYDNELRKNNEFLALKYKLLCDYLRESTH